MGWSVISLHRVCCSYVCVCVCVCVWVGACAHSWGAAAGRFNCVFSHTGVCWPQLLIFTSGNTDHRGGKEETGEKQAGEEGNVCEPGRKNLNEWELMTDLYESELSIAVQPIIEKKRSKDN